MKYYKNEVNVLKCSGSSVPERLADRTHAKHDVQVRADTIEQELEDRQRRVVDSLLLRFVTQRVANLFKLVRFVQVWHLNRNAEEASDSRMYKLYTTGDVMFRQQDSYVCFKLS